MQEPVLLYFNVRVYGLLINPIGQILVADEAFKSGVCATKFPGGGVELGEGLADALKREFLEETGTEIEIEEHFFTTDFFVRSQLELSPHSQIISVYYLVTTPHWQLIKTSSVKFDFKFIKGTEAESFRWVHLNELKNESHITLPTDVKVVQLLNNKRRL